MKDRNGRGAFTPLEAAPRFALDVETVLSVDLLRGDQAVIRSKLMALPSPASPKQLREFAELPE